MISGLSITISGLAILFSVLKFPALSTFRCFLVLLALGAGQIHLAILALILFLFAELGFRVPSQVPAKSFVILLSLYLATLLVTLFSSTNGRTISELIQLFAYIFIFFQLQAVLQRPNEAERIIRLSAYAAFTVTVLGLGLKQLGLTQVPGIFLARGANEGAIFLSLMGVVPTVFLFLRTRNPVYLLMALIMVYAQIVATSRSTYALSIVTLMSVFFFVWKHIWVRVLLSFAVCALSLANVSWFMSVWQSQQNYSVLQRILLYEAGYEFWSEQPWFGWGWGSSSTLVPQNTLTDIAFPHFHSTYVQFIVELGALGWAVIFLWAIMVIWFVIKGLYSSLPKEDRAYIALSAFTLLFSGFTEVMLFGADRAIQVIFLLAIGLRLATQARHTSRLRSTTFTTNAN